MDTTAHTSSGKVESFIQTHDVAAVEESDSIFTYDAAAHAALLEAAPWSKEYVFIRFCCEHSRDHVATRCPLQRELLQKCAHVSNSSSKDGTMVRFSAGRSTFAATQGSCFVSGYTCKIRREHRSDGNHAGDCSTEERTISKHCESLIVKWNGLT
jgi:hypothetical protein